MHLTSWWRHQMETFSALLAICAGNSPVPVNSPHKGQWRGALMFSLIFAWINDWVNNRETGDLRRHRGHYDVIVMFYSEEFGWIYHPRPHRCAVRVKRNRAQNPVYYEMHIPADKGTVCSGDKENIKTLHYLPFVRGIQEGPVMQKVFPCREGIMINTQFTLII